MCGHSKESSQGDGSFEHPKRMFKLMGKKIMTNFLSKFAQVTGTMCHDITNLYYLVSDGASYLPFGSRPNSWYKLSIL